jgi:hypothetical protein
MKPTKTKLNKAARKRGSTMRKAESGLLNKAVSLQSKLNGYILNVLMPSLDISNGKISNTTANLKKINKATGLKKFMRTVVNQAMFEYYDTQFRTLTGQTNNYFSPFEPTKAAQKRITDKGTVIVSGFLDSLFDNNDIVRGLQNTLKNSVVTSQSTIDLEKLITEQIKGKEGKFGTIEAYHYRNGSDEFQAYSRTLDDNFSKALNLNYAIYAGGEITTTRDFCEDRNGKVFNRETILSWNHTPADWQGRKAENSILIDMGGYNCRHDFDWISWQLAKRLNPSIEKSEFDKK